MRAFLFIVRFPVLLPLIYFLPCYRLIFPENELPCKGNAILHSIQNPHLLPVSSIRRYDIIITEIMSDPSPPVGLPEYEYVELKNNSSLAIDLKGCKLGDESSAAIFSGSIILQPDSFLICCSNTAATPLRSFGRTAGLSNFPSLANESDLVKLISPEGHIIHAVQYQSNWHRNSIKAEGGWSLEMINTSTPCAGAYNWSSSNSPNGGSPGHGNSQPPGMADQQPPALLRSYSLDSTRIVAVFDEPLDSNSAGQPKNYVFSPGNLASISCQAIPPLFQQVQLKLQQPVKTNSMYELNVLSLKDCSGNTIGVMNKVKAGLASAVTQGDIIINEVLFDPPPEGADYIELFNRSGNIINLQHLFCSNRNNANQLVNTKAISAVPLQLFPGDYIVLSENIGWVQGKYAIKDRNALLSTVLPSLPNDKGSFVLTNAAGLIIDELQYANDWHFPLLSATEGVSLERIDPQSPAQEKSNWLSAATTAGGGTPGYMNSQYRSMQAEQEPFQLSSPVFSPDLDGHDDLLFIRYKMTGPGAVGTARIFDIAGKPVRQLNSNALMGASGSWAWDGLSETKLPLPPGIYIVQVNWFNLQGVSKRWKKAVALVRGH